MAAYMGQWVTSLPTSLVSVEWHIKLLFIASYGRYGQLTSDNWQSLALTISAPWGQGKLLLIWWLDRHGGSNWIVVVMGWGEW